VVVQVLSAVGLACSMAGQAVVGTETGEPFGCAILIYTASVTDMTDDTRGFAHHFSCAVPAPEPEPDDTRDGRFG
jgi:hypothetical protein